MSAPARMGRLVLEAEVIALVEMAVTLWEVSADNYHVVRRDPADGTWVVSMGFESQETEPCKIPVDTRDQRHPDEERACIGAAREWSEYGVSTEQWCHGSSGHVVGCRRRDVGAAETSHNSQPSRPTRVEKENQP